MKYLEENILNPLNTHKKNFQTNEIAAMKNFGPTKYPQDKILGL